MSKGFTLVEIIIVLSIILILIFSSSKLIDYLKPVKVEKDKSNLASLVLNYKLKSRDSDNVYLEIFNDIAEENVSPDYNDSQISKFSTSSGNELYAEISDSYFFVLLIKEKLATNSYSYYCFSSKFRKQGLEINNTDITVMPITYTSFVDYCRSKTN